MSRKYIFDVSTLMKVFVALDINNLFKFHCINCGTVAPMAWQDVACNQAGSQFSMDASSSCTVRKKIQGVTSSAFLLGGTSKLLSVHFDFVRK